MSAEIRRKSHQNRRLQRMFSTGDESDPDKRKRLSWSESDTEVCKTREGSMKRSKPPPRQCLTLDLGSPEPPERAGQVLDPIALLPLSSSAPMPSLTEEEEMETELSPMIQNEGGNEEEEESKFRRGQSSKNKLKRQGGMDSQSAQPDEGKQDGQGGSGDNVFSP